jgi:hypothetical protein
MAELKDGYRRAWTRNQMLFAHVGSAAEALGEAGIDTLVLKGGALARLDYEDVGVRPMSDLDLLVHPEDAQNAGRLLTSLGWTTTLEAPSKALGVLYAQHFRQKSFGVDLHWHAFMRCQPDDDVWENAVPLELGAARTSAPDAASRLMNICIHAAECGDTPPIWWVADAAAIVDGGQVDWSELVDRSRRRGVTIILGETLRFIRERFDVPVPLDALDALDASPRSRFERAAWRATLRPRSISAVVAQEWFRYRRVGAGRSLRGYARYLQISMGYDRRRDLANHVVRRLRHGRVR